MSKQDASGDAPVRDLFLDRAAFDAWATDYRARLREEPRSDAARADAMNRVNPKFVLRNHLAGNRDSPREREGFLRGRTTGGRAAPSLRRAA